jgi:glycosyltransferase involved in cell wall biosynthesis
LAEELARKAATVTVVPSLVDTEAAPVRSHVDRESVVLGWIGSFGTAPYLDSIAGSLERVAIGLAPRRVELLTVGGEAPPLRGVASTAISWSEAAERDVLSRMDIGLMPLPDTPWTRGKCAYKALQYMASGIPAVVDDVGISASAVGIGGRAVRNADQWVEALTELAGSAALRAEIGARGRARVKEEYSVQRWAPVLSRIWGG